MPDALPQSNLTILDGQLGSSFALGTDMLCVIGCSSAGPLQTPRIYTSVGALLAGAGHGPAVEAAAYALHNARRKVLFVRTPSTTVGANSAFDDDAVTGTSTVTLTGEPLDSYEGRFLVVAGGTIGTAGITFRYSLDGAATWSPVLALGTASTYVIPNTGLTLNFAAGTLVAADAASWVSTEPRWDATDLTDAFAALGLQQQLALAVNVVGIIAATDLDDIDDELEAYAADKRRYMFAFASARRQYLPCRKIGSATVSFVEGGGSADTITRSAGSFVSDGFKAGMTITVFGSVSNDGTYTIATVAALTLTLATGDDLAAEATVSNVTITGVETRSAWMASLRSDFDSHSSTRVAVSAGHARTKSPSAKRKPRRPASWAASSWFMAHDMSRSLAEVQLGELPGVTLYDSAGDAEDHDESTEGLAIDGRFLCLTSLDGFNGTYVALPLILHPPGSDFSRVHLRAVMDRACAVAQKAGVIKLSSTLELGADGKVLEIEASRFETFVQSRLDKELLEGTRRVSAVSFTLSRDDVLTEPGTTLKAKVRVRPLFYAEQIEAELAFDV